MKNNKEIKCCPYCEHDEFYRVTIVSGRTESHYRFDGADAENSHLHESIHYRDLKAAYCCQCQKKLPTSVAPRTARSGRD